MKRKHWAGYGTIDVTVKSFTKAIFHADFGYKIWCKKLVVEMTGEHECGLAREDNYDMYEYVVKHFKKYKGVYDSERDIIKMDVDLVDWDKCIYTFYLRCAEENL